MGSSAFSLVLVGSGGFWWVLVGSRGFRWFLMGSCHPFIHAFIHSRIHPFIHASIHSSTHASIHPGIHPFIHASIHSHNHASINTSMHPFIHTYKAFKAGPQGPFKGLPSRALKRPSPVSRVAGYCLFKLDLNKYDRVLLYQVFFEKVRYGIAFSSFEAILGYLGLSWPT